MTIGGRHTVSLPSGRYQFVHCVNAYTVSRNFIEPADRHFPALRRNWFPQLHLRCSHQQTTTRLSFVNKYDKISQTPTVASPRCLPELTNTAAQVRSLLTRSISGEK